MVKAKTCKGVHLAASGRYLAQINLLGKNRFVGNFPSQIEAASVHDKIHDLKVNHSHKQALKKLEKIKEQRKKKKNTLRKIGQRKIKIAKKKKIPKKKKAKPQKMNKRKTQPKLPKNKKRKRTKNGKKEQPEREPPKKTQDDEDSIQRIKATAALISLEEMSDDFAEWLHWFGKKASKDPSEYLLKGGMSFLALMKERYDAKKTSKRRSIEKQNTKKIEKQIVEREAQTINELKGTWKIMTGTWSKAQKRAFGGRMRSPSSFYYRFSKQSEPRRDKGTPWTNEEYKPWMESLKIFGANRMWGFFSLHVPGRCGFSCSNKYRDFMKWGWVYEPNYTFSKDPKRNMSFTCDDQNKYYHSLIVLFDPSKTLKTPWCHDLADSDTKHKCFVAQIQEKAFSLCKTIK